MRRRGSWFAAAALLVCSASCRTLPFPDPDYQGSYGKVLRKWTRSVALYSGLETRAFVRVVFLSPDYVTAQAAELSRQRAELPDQARATLEKMRAESRAPTFFAVVYLPDRTADDWNQRDSVWRIALNEGLGEVAPKKIVRFDRPFNAELKALYPYLDEYSTGYLLQFPDPEAPPQQPVPGHPVAADQAGTVAAQQPNFHPADATLVTASALGKMTFHWRLDGTDAPESGATAGPPEKPPEAPKP